jgi:HAD superfamily hydrolase (TIGR01509 family)
MVIPRSFGVELSTDSAQIIAAMTTHDASHGPGRTPTAVLFDADGVLQRAPADLQTRLTQMLGGVLSDREACMADYFAAEAPCLTGAANFAEALAPVIAKWKATCEAAALLAAWSTIEVDNSVLAVVAGLRRAGLYCALASNQEHHRALHMSETLAYRDVFDREFYSCHLGHMKPSPEYFHEIVRLAELDPARTLFIDDRIDNVEAARKAGLQAAQFVLGEMGAGAEPMRRLLAQHGLALTD